MEHKIIKTILISKVVELIASEYKVTIDEARDRLYTSPLIDMIDDDETGLYGQSAYYSLSIYESLQKQ